MSGTQDFMTTPNSESETAPAVDLHRLVSLIWSDPAQPQKDGCHYNHTIAETPFGRFLLTWKGWKESPDYGFEETPWGEVEYHGWNTVAEAQEWASQEITNRIARCFEANDRIQIPPAIGVQKAETASPGGL